MQITSTNSIQRRIKEIEKTQRKISKEMKRKERGNLRKRRCQNDECT